MQEHIRDSRKERCEKRPLYNAMNKYGVENFYIEEVEQCSPSVASEREQYWIAYYRGYEEGYNATKGGDGKNIYDHEAIAEALRENPYPSDIAKQFSCSTDIVRAIAKSNNIPIKNKGQQNVNKPKEVEQWTKDGKYVQTFCSVQKAVEWCVENKTCACVSSGARTGIANVANGKAKTAYGYIWRYTGN